MGKTFSLLRYNFIAAAPLSPLCRLLSGGLPEKIGTFFLERFVDAIISRRGDARRERYIGEGVFGARERDTQRLSYAAFFGYFLGGTRK